ncbi:unnamed protein product, partial [Cylicostephanus goldi]
MAEEKKTATIKLYRDNVPRITITYKNKKDLYKNFQKKLKQLNLDMGEVYWADWDNDRTAIKGAEDLFAAVDNNTNVRMFYRPKANKEVFTCPSCDDEDEEVIKKIDLARRLVRYPVVDIALTLTTIPATVHDPAIIIDATDLHLVHHFLLTTEDIVQDLVHHRLIADAVDPAHAPDDAVTTTIMVMVIVHILLCLLASLHGIHGSRHALHSIHAITPEEDIITEEEGAAAVTVCAKNSTTR